MIGRGSTKYAAVGSMLLDNGFHSIRIEMYNELSPAFIDWNWEPPQTKAFGPIPYRYLYKEVPSQIIYEKDLRFQSIHTIAIFAGCLLTLLCLGWLAFFHHPGIRRDLSIPMALAIFVDAFLLQARWLEPDFRYGLNWFIALSAFGKVLIIIIPVLLAMPMVRGIIRAVPGWVAEHKGIGFALFIISILSGLSGQAMLTGPVRIRPAMGLVLLAVSAISLLLNVSIFRSGQEVVSGGADRAGAAFRWMIFMLILLISAFMRFYRLPEMPPGLWWDEAQTGIAARDILNGNFPSIYDLRINAGSIASYLLAGWFLSFRIIDLYDARLYGDRRYHYHCCFISLLPAVLQ